MPVRGFSLAAIAALNFVLLASSGYVPPRKFLIVSNAAQGTIAYARIPQSGNISSLKTLVSTDLQHPQGLAIDQKRQLLLVSDSGLRKVVSYGLQASGDTLSVDDQTTVADNIESRWVAVDGQGNVFFSDELNSKIYQVPARNVFDGNSSGEVLFDGAQSGAVSAPGGIASDNFYLYWTHKADAGTKGSVVRALQAEAGQAPKELPSTSPVTLLSTEGAKAYGLCLAINNLFFTDSDDKLFGVLTTGGPTVTISDKLKNPRGCAWDGDNTVYIADRSRNGVFAFTAPMTSLAQTEMRQVAEFEEAFGLAIFSKAPMRRTTQWAVALLAWFVWTAFGA